MISVIVMPQVKIGVALSKIGLGIIGNILFLVDAPFWKTVKCISNWGVGSGELVKSIRQVKKVAMS